ncbi:Asp-tRNA(Asn)/Glu-tRNA(Gln) amidotransferase subunit GatC [Solitalea koreensis]|uniref:Aspartyl/glutamyl-tRNA(Asn/Gln) amidotransferase subunit C n=1 Tax=Solitalea koreensis TaxID=543615 RepID=A0A521DCM5_9SPHI|nr:Asp-tRNA(Asn)/Glu-tRNA(Gln) amidotransferase subunit GatC [Solitalea koreensis]SMO69386.1 aspartyl/glutamyl-tRNA(Asn/Gln) amidotransferase subunit C [Solitalea koreensis]
MKIDKNVVEKIAHLARLDVEDVDKSVADLSKILTFMEKLNELDTENVEPLIYMTDEVNVFRKDEVKQDITTDEALKNAPKRNENYFRVAKVIEQ